MKRCIRRIGILFFSVLFICGMFGSVFADEYTDEMLDAEGQAQEEQIVYQGEPTQKLYYYVDETSGITILSNQGHYAVFLSGNGSLSAIQYLTDAGITKIDDLVFMSGIQNAEEALALKEQFAPYSIYASSAPAEIETSTNTTFYTGDGMTTLYNGNNGTIGAYIDIDGQHILLADGLSDIEFLSENTELSALDMLSISDAPMIDMHTLEMFDPATVLITWTQDAFSYAREFDGTYAAQEGDIYSITTAPTFIVDIRQTQELGIAGYYMHNGDELMGDVRTYGEDPVPEEPTPEDVPPTDGQDIPTDENPVSEEITDQPQENTEETGNLTDETENQEVPPVEEQPDNTDTENPDAENPPADNPQSEDQQEDQPEEQPEDAPIFEPIFEEQSEELPSNEAVAPEPESDETEEETQLDKTEFEVAVEVMNGVWGSGQARIDYLTQYGYDANAVQDIVNKTYDPSLGVCVSVVFMNNGHGTAPEPMVISSGSVIEQPWDLSEDGMIFLGWFADEACTIPFDFSQPIESAVRIYAGWQEPEPETEPETEPEPIYYTATFNMNGYGTQPESQQIQEGTAVVKPADPADDNMTFTGWYVGEDPTVLYDFNTPIYSDVQINAGWKAKTYAIQFDANDGLGVMQQQTFNFGETKKLDANAFTRAGWNFSGWNAHADGSGRYFQDQETITNLINIDGGTVTLYAQWAENRRVLEGDGQTINDTTPLTFYINGKRSEYVGMTIDGTEIPASIVDIWSNDEGIHLTIQPGKISYSPGEHTVVFHYSDGSTCTAKFTSISDNPKTGDDTSRQILLYTAMGAVAIFLIIMAVRKLKMAKKR